MDTAPTRYEDLPDEILLLIHRYLPQCDLIWALYGLNYRLNCTIAHAFGSITVTSRDLWMYGKARLIFPLIGKYVWSITQKHCLLTAKDFHHLPNLQELNYVHGQPETLPSLPSVTDLNILPLRRFNLIQTISNLTSLHSLYVSPSIPLSIPAPVPQQTINLQQLSVPLASLDDFYRILSYCPQLTFLAVTLPHFNPPMLTADELAAIRAGVPMTLRTFAFQHFPYVEPYFNSIKYLFSLLPATLACLSVDITTDDRRCFDGSVWQECLQEYFPRLSSFEFFLCYQPNIRVEPHPLKLPAILPTFSDSYWTVIVPQGITGYPLINELSVHSNLIPKVNRRRYFYD